MKHALRFGGLLAAVALAGLLSGCASTEGKAMDPAAKAALEVTVRIAVRRAVADSPRAAEKAANIRKVVGELQAVASAESTVAGLESLVRVQVDKLTLSPIDRADANDLITLLGAVLEARFGSQDAEVRDKLVQVNEFLQFVLSALPAPASA